MELGIYQEKLIESNRHETHLGERLLQQKVGVHSNHLFILHVLRERKCKPRLFLSKFPSRITVETDGHVSRNFSVTHTSTRTQSFSDNSMTNLVL